MGVGSMLHTVGRFLGRELVMEAEITQWIHPTCGARKQAMAR